MASNIEMITLKDGSQVPNGAFFITMRAIETLKTIELWDLQQLCKNPKHEVVPIPSGDYRVKLYELSLIDNKDEVHDIVKDIVRNAVRGRGLDVKVAPYEDILGVSILDKLKQLNRVELWDLYELCKDPKHKIVASPFGDAKVQLKKLNLIDDEESVPEAVKSVVLDNVISDNLRTRLKS
jgi:hypothetical protein